MVKNSFAIAPESIPCSPLKWILTICLAEVGFLFTSLLHIETTLFSGAPLLSTINNWLDSSTFLLKDATTEDESVIFKLWSS